MHRAIQNAYHEDSSFTIIFPRLTLYYQNKDITSTTLYHPQKEFLDRVNHYLKRLIPTGRLNKSESMTWKIPNKLSPLLVMIQLPYSPNTHRYNNISLIHTTKLDNTKYMPSYYSSTTADPYQQYRTTSMDKISLGGN